MRANRDQGTTEAGVEVGLPNKLHAIPGVGAMKRDGAIMVTGTGNESRSVSHELWSDRIGVYEEFKRRVVRRETT